MAVSQALAGNSTGPRSRPRNGFRRSAFVSNFPRVLERQTSPTGVVYYHSPVIGAVGAAHAFSTRLGGVSPPPFDSMNLGNPNGCGVRDDDARIGDNYRRLQAAVGLGGRELLRVHQVHGGVVATARPGEPFDASAKADAVVGTDPSRVPSVRVADCVPVLLASADGAVVAAVHAGWRGGSSRAS